MSAHRPLVTVFGSSSAAAGSRDYEDGVTCGRLLASAGIDVATGGYGGLMEAVSKGAAVTGGRVIGVTAPSVFPRRSGANTFVSEEMPATDLIERIRILVSEAAGVIALPGSLGTATELIVAWNLAYVSPSSGEPPRPVVTVGSKWRRVVDTLAAELETNRSLVTSVVSVDEAVAVVLAALPR